MTHMPQHSNMFDAADLTAEFLDSANAALQELERLIDAADPQSFPAFVRQLHSLKGNAQVFGFSDIARCCHRLEDCLVGQSGWSPATSSQARLYLVHLDVAIAQVEAEAL